jgi:Arc/MetJ-type ribon-helix-helix transcriptional regulator
MIASGKIRVTLAADQAQRIDEIVATGEFATPAEVVRQALRAWLGQRREDALRHAAIHEHIGRPFGKAPLAPEPVERVALLFDAGDAKA